MEERELPLGWCWSRLADICSRIVDGSHNPPKSSDTGLPMLSARNIENRSINLDADYRLISLGDFEHENRRTNISAGDVLLTIVGSIGRTAEVTEGLLPFTLQRSVAVLKPTEGATSRYLSYALESPDFQQFLVENSKGTAQKGIYLKALGNALIAVSPMDEQRQIAAKLDTTIASVDACRQRLDGVAAILKRFRQALLAAATSGELTREWREETAINPEWEDKELASICLSIADGDHQAPPKADEGIPFITISAINDAVLRVEKATRYVPESYYNGLSETRKAREDDILFSVTGSVGIPALVDSQQRFVFQRHIALLRPNRAKVLPKFLYFLLLSEDVNRQCLKVATGTAQLTVSLGSLRSMTLRIPSLQEQAEINERVQDLFTLADQLEARLTAARKVVDRLTPALLAKAFRGELVPQDPNDEPASVVLERIRAASNARSTGSAASQRGRRKATDHSELSSLAPTPVPTNDPSRVVLVRTGDESTPGERGLNRVSKSKPLHNLKGWSPMQNDLIQILEQHQGWISASTACEEMGISDGSSSDDLELFFRQLKEQVNGGVVDVQRRGDEDWLKLTSRKVA